MGVAQDHRPPGADVVDVAAAVDVDDARALGARDEERRSAHRLEGAHRRVDAAGNDSSARERTALRTGSWPKGDTDPGSRPRAGAAGARLRAPMAEKRASALVDPRRPRGARRATLLRRPRHRGAGPRARHASLRLRSRASRRQRGSAGGRSGAGGSPAPGLLRPEGQPPPRVPVAAPRPGLGRPRRVLARRGVPRPRVGMEGGGDLLHGHERELARSRPAFSRRRSS